MFSCPSSERRVQICRSIRRCMYYALFGKNTELIHIMSQQQQQQTQQPEVDEDGYCIQPKDTLWDTEAAKKGKMQLSRAFLFPQTFYIFQCVFFSFQMVSIRIQTAIRTEIRASAKYTLKLNHWIMDQHRFRLVSMSYVQLLRIYHYHHWVERSRYEFIFLAQMIGFAYLTTNFATRDHIGFNTFPWYRFAYRKIRQKKLGIFS